MRLHIVVQCKNALALRVPQPGHNRIVLSRIFPQIYRLYQTVASREAGNDIPCLPSVRRTVIHQYNLIVLPHPPKFILNQSHQLSDCPA